MRAIDRKLIRDLAHIWPQALAIALVLACGTATFVMSLNTLQSLRHGQAAYYDRYGFADVFAHLKRAPNRLAGRLEEIPGVARAETRILVDVTLDVEGLTETAVGRLVSIPERSQPALNRLHLRSGRLPDTQRSGEVLASQAFADAHGFVPGDSVKAVLNGRFQQLRIVGVALSPEFVYEVQGAGEIIPDNRRFGVFWMPYPQLAAAFNMEGAFNDVTLSLMRGASEPEVLRRLDLVLEPYGGQAAYGRYHQASHRRVSDEIQQLGAMAVIPPAIFMAVACFLFNVVLSRLIGLQREQIAALKALGYSRGEIGRHYAKAASLIVLCGVTPGIVLGSYLGRGLTALYTQFFRFPLFEYRVEPAVVLLAAAVGAAAAALGTASAVRRAVRLPPAEAMRPEPPANYRRTLPERLGLGRYLSQTSRMILRRLQRHPLRALLTSIGIALAVAVLVLGNCFSDSVDYVLDFQFHLAQRHDVLVSLVEPASGSAVFELCRLPGVLRCEPYRAVPARFRHRNLWRRLSVTGLAADRQLLRLLDDRTLPVDLPDQGLLLSKTLAEFLDVQPGRTVQVEVLEGERPVLELPVSALVTDFGSMAAYMDLNALHRVMKEGHSLSGAFLLTDPSRSDQLHERLKEMPSVAGVSVEKTSLALMRRQISDLMLRMEAINGLFAVIIAFGMVYNSARISLSERSRELASLRVLGYTRAEISSILLGEVGLLTLSALPVGLLLGRLFAGLAMAAVQTETQRFPLLIEPSTYALAVAVTLLAALVSGLVVRRRIDRLDLIAALKSRE